MDIIYIIKYTLQFFEFSINYAFFHKKKCASNIFFFKFENITKYLYK